MILYQKSEGKKIIIRDVFSYDKPYYIMKKIDIGVLEAPVLADQQINLCFAQINIPTHVYIYLNY